MCKIRFAATKDSVVVSTWEMAVAISSEEQVAALHGLLGRCSVSKGVATWQELIAEYPSVCAQGGGG